MNPDAAYKFLLRDVLANGKEDRNPRPKWPDNTPAHSLQIHTRLISFDINKGELPFICLRPIPYKSAIKELFWIYLKKSNKLEDLHDLGVKWWDSWDIGDGTIGSCYGHTVARYNLFEKLIYGLKNNPESRRHVMNLYQYDELSQPHGLDPCAFETIWNVRYEDDATYLDMQLNQRSCDLIAGVPSNWAQYSVLLCMVAHTCDMKPGVFSWVGTNIHIYDRLIPVAKTLISRTSKSSYIPKICEIKKKDILSDDFRPDDIEIIGYSADKINESCPQIKFEVAI